MATEIQILSKIQNLLSKTNANIAIGYQKLSVTGTLANLTVPIDATYARFTLESADIGISARCLSTNQIAVTTAEGNALVNLDRFDVDGIQNLSNFQIIRVQGGNTDLFIEYYK